MTPNKQKPGAAATATGSLFLQNPREGVSLMNVVFWQFRDKPEAPLRQILVLDANRYPTLVKHWPGIIGSSGGQPE